MIPVKSVLPSGNFLADTCLPEDLNFTIGILKILKKEAPDVNFIDFRIHENHENVVFFQILPLLDCHKINMGTNFENPMVKIWILS